MKQRTITLAGTIQKLIDRAAVQEPQQAQILDCRSRLPVRRTANSQHPQGRKSPPSWWTGLLGIHRFDPIAEASAFSDHFCSAPSLGLKTPVLGNRLLGAKSSKSADTADGQLPRWFVDARRGTVPRYTISKTDSTALARPTYIDNQRLISSESH